jgi:hypothetical protein
MARGRAGWHACSDLVSRAQWQGRGPAGAGGAKPCRNSDAASAAPALRGSSGKRLRAGTAIETVLAALAAGTGLVLGTDNVGCEGAVVARGDRRSHCQARNDARAMHLPSPLVQTLIILGLPGRTARTHAPTFVDRHGGPDISAAPASGGAMPAFWLLRLVPLRFCNLHAPSSFTRGGLLGLQASEGMWVCKSEIFTNFDFTPLTGPVARTELHTFGDCRVCRSQLSLDCEWRPERRCWQPQTTHEGEQAWPTTPSIAVHTAP